ncbi:MAG: acetyl-CoA carboxylase biotin carboxyl carrier protein [Gemmatimonadetes bacterium]|nr:acetyl-CoA carboxylase biotin carboxyl carrier protein [Gemmatimonadota bacterium]MDA1104231.1 acetyl-CoA carboxylase biotin carboxyl carrier protein [Gemmatimonadota bacterium]
MDFEFIEGLIRALDDSSIDSLEIERGGTRIRLAKSPTTVAGPVTMAAPPVVAAAAVAPASAVGNAPPIGAPATSVPTVASNLLEITSPMVGTFYLAPAPDAPDYVEVGGRVSPGDTLCIIEAMKLMNELECEISGRIAEICVSNAQPVEFGQVLFRVDPS